MVLPGLLESLGRQTALGKLRLGRVVVVADYLRGWDGGDCVRGFGAEVLERQIQGRGEAGGACGMGLAVLGISHGGN